MLRGDSDLVELFESKSRAISAIKKAMRVNNRIFVADRLGNREFSEQQDDILWERIDRAKSKIEARDDKIRRAEDSETWSFDIYTFIMVAVGVFLLVLFLPAIYFFVAFSLIYFSSRYGYSFSFDPLYLIALLGLFIFWKMFKSRRLVRDIYNEIKGDLEEMANENLGGEINGKK